MGDEQTSMQSNEIPHQESSTPPLTEASKKSTIHELEKKKYFSLLFFSLMKYL